MRFIPYKFLPLYFSVIRAHTQNVFQDSLFRAGIMLKKVVPTQKATQEQGTIELAAAGKEGWKSKVLGACITAIAGRSYYEQDDVRGTGHEFREGAGLGRRCCSDAAGKYMLSWPWIEMQGSNFHDHLPDSTLNDIKQSKIEEKSAGRDGARMEQARDLAQNDKRKSSCKMATGCAVAEFWSKKVPRLGVETMIGRKRLQNAVDFPANVGHLGQSRGIVSVHL
ncbi:hypothetical protein B0H14DRAFT_2592615 [Mycena olivaceomarginata]|nr:hypothetical protein B0H14DRAFT_2592615 [Mycena olivaceomarginata]